MSKPAVKKYDELSEEERLAHKERVDRLNAKAMGGFMALVKMGEQIKAIGKLEDRATNDQFSPETIKQHDDTFNLLERYLSVKDRVIEPEERELIRNLIALVNTYRKESTDAFKLLNNRTLIDTSRQQLRNNAGKNGLIKNAKLRLG